MGMAMPCPYQGISIIIKMKWYDSWLLSPEFCFGKLAYRYNHFISPDFFSELEAQRINEK
jgi:hypothetical protein